MVTKNIKKKIKEHFFVHPSSKLRVRQMERKLGLSLPSVIRYCKELEKEDILKKVETSGIVFFTSHRESEKFLLEKRLFNIKSIFDSGLISYLIKEYSNPVIILFGSYSKGEDIEESDIDLYIETPSKKEVKLEKFENILKRKIQVFKNKHISDMDNRHLVNNIVNGITLNNYLEVFK